MSNLAMAPLRSLDGLGRFGHEAPIPGLGGVDGGGGHLLVKLLEEIERALPALRADHAVAGVYLKIVLYGGNIELLVAQPVFLRDLVGDLIGRSLIQPFGRLVEG